MNTSSAINLLLVEDDEDDYLLTCDLLEQSKVLTFKVDWASSVDQARSLLLQDIHDICLMDYQLGPEIGINLVKEAINAGFSSPIIMLTARENMNVEVEAAKAGAVDYLIKENLSLEQLLRSIRYALVRSEVQSERFERLKAEAANRSKSYFLANLSHEIRTPLTSIIGYTELLVNQYEKSLPELNSKLEVINRNSKHLLSLINNTLDLSKIEAGKLEINITDTAMAPFLADLISLATAMAKKQDIQFQVILETKIPEMIKTDSIRLSQILINLLGNAFKFTHEGEVKLIISLNQSLERKFLKFSIKDTGIGIKSDELKMIFSPFMQSGQTLYGNGGTGLGLTISQRLAENLGGFITVHSKHGKGSTFTLSIDPGMQIESYIRKIDFKTGSNSEIKPEPAISYNLENKKVIIADDVADIRSLLGSILTDAGLQYENCSNGQEVLSLLETSDDYGVILLDLGMPVMDGYETIVKIREKAITIPTIALTAASMQGEKERCMEIGFDGYISKPVSTATLLNTITEVMENHTSGIGVSSATPVTPKLANEAKILVVEDNADANLAICQLLELLGYHSKGVSSSDEAKSLLENESYGIILTDINLKDSNGLELAKELHSGMKELKIYLMSGEENINNSLIPDFIAGFIKKPIMLESLKAILN